jgi:cellulose synthase (UDP-forming)
MNGELNEKSPHAFSMHRLFPWIGLPVLVAVLGLVAVIPMSWQQQAFFGVAMVVAALVLDRAHRGRPATILLVLLCLCATTRYAYWRGAMLWNYLDSPWSHVSIAAAVLMLILISAEFYTFVILVLGFLQTVAPLERLPVAMPEDVDSWPTVDVLIPTFNESLDVVRYTVLAAQQIDWPAHKLNIVLLDDGSRTAFRQFATQAGVRYIARMDHSGAKAGNLNNALRQTRGDFVTIFDCDHIPTRSFLQISIGWFLRDASLGMLQTPHHFYSPDPFEKNLGKFRKVPNEGSLFYGIVQDANDLWNATFFCGSCAVLRRASLDEIGGIAQETVTEDAHTSLLLQKAGWNTAYLNIPQAAGLATETLARHIKQRVRWARGMVQILRVDNPLFSRGLTLAQRLCYFNATLHFLYAFPRLVFLTAPLLYLIFGLSNVPGYWLAILSFAGPHLALTTITNSRIQGSKRFSFWNEIYETVLSPYILLPTLFALISPKSGKFNVTDKGGAQEEGYFSRRLAVPFLVLLLMNLIGIGMAVPRYLYWDRGHDGTIAVNVFWALLNIVILGVALSVCAEVRQRRHSVRVACEVPVVLRASGEVVEGMTTDISTGGLAAKVGALWALDAPVEIEFPDESVEERLHGTVVGAHGDRLQIAFSSSDIAEQRLLTSVLYSRADRWLTWDDAYAKDHPLRSLLSVVQASVAGFWKLLTMSPQRVAPAAASPVKPVRTAVIASIVLALIALAVWRANASTTRPPKETPPATIQRSFTLGSLGGVKDTFMLEQPGSRQVLRFATPASWLLRGGKLHLKYQIPRNAPEEYTYADLRLNDSVLASITPTAEERDAGAGEIVVPLPPELLTARNQLVIQLAGNGNTACAAPAQKNPPWFRIDPSSEVMLDVQPLAVASELASLPQPFLEHLANQPVELPFVFAHAPSDLDLRSAGVLASWFGSLADDSGIRYAMQVGELPTGDAIVFLVGSEQIGSDQLGNSFEGAAPGSISLQANPRDPFGKLLVVHGQTSWDMLAVAQGLTIGRLKMSGSAAALTEAVTLNQRKPNDAPRWIHDGRINLDSLLTPAELRTNGQNPVTVYMHLAPDYNFGVQQNMYLHLAYAVQSAELAKSSNVATVLNQVPVSGIPISDTPEAKVVDIPLADGRVAVYANTLQVQFYFVSPGADPCIPSAGSSSAQILKSSYLDLNGAVHYTELPNLQLFAKAGFPFTRMADLSETTVVMPSGAQPEVAALYLDLMGYFGAQTGYPALGVQVASSADLSHLGDRDLLILGTFPDLGSISDVTSQLPLTYADRSFSLNSRARAALMMDWVMQRNRNTWEALKDSELISADGLVEGIASPFSSGRSVVLIAAHDRKALTGLASALLTTMPLEGIDSTATLWTSGKFTSYPLSTAVYGSGDLPWYRAFGYWLPNHLFALLLLLFVILALLAAWTLQYLSYRIKARLNVGLNAHGAKGRNTTAASGSAFHNAT